MLVQATLIHVASAVMGMAITAFYIGRSLLQPLDRLSNAMKKVAAKRTSEAEVRAGKNGDLVIEGSLMTIPCPAT